MSDYCPYAWLIPWTPEGQAYAKKVREKKERDLARKTACRKQKKLVLGRMANARKRTRRHCARKFFHGRRLSESLLATSNESGANTGLRRALAPLGGGLGSSSASGLSGAPRFPPAAISCERP